MGAANERDLWRKDADSEDSVPLTSCVIMS